MLRLPQIQALHTRLHASLEDETVARARSSAVVFAPHQDDETLGCGGTMLLKTAARTALSCVFMTDGVTSHQMLMDADELRNRRKQEALAATAHLGLASDQIRFLDFPDGRLSRHHDAAVAAVVELVDALEPEEVYVPYRRDGLPDHEATYRIATAALRAAGRRARVLEYPVWFWNCWPWVSLPLAASRSTIQAARRAADARFGWRMLQEFRSGVTIRPVLAQKREALEMYRTQMTALRSDAPWPTLADVSHGEFLECFFRSVEIFRRSEGVGG